MRHPATALLALGLATAGLAGCTTVPPVAACPSVPPPPPNEVIPPLPAIVNQPLMLRPGHWEWTGSSYRWSPAKWVPRAGHGPLWQDGYWLPGPPGAPCTWVAPHWE